MINHIQSWRWHEKAQGWVCSAAGIAVLSRRPMEAGPPPYEVTVNFVAEVMHKQKRRERHLDPEPEMSDEEFSANWRALLDTLSDDHIKRIYEAIS